MEIKRIFDDCMNTAREIVEPHLKETYDKDIITKQVWEVAIILFQHELNKPTPIKTIQLK